MKNFVRQTQNTIRIKAEKPHADGRFYIRDKYLREARDTGKKMVVDLNGEKYVFTFREWMDGAKKMEKVFLIPDKPMKLYGNYLKKFEMKKPIEQISVMSAFAQLSEDQRLQVEAALRR